MYARVAHLRFALAAAIVALAIVVGVQWSMLCTLQQDLAVLERAPGPQGEQGIPGRGVAGPPGFNGLDGVDGRDGQDGRDGRPGAEGQRGVVEITFGGIEPAR